MRGGEARKGVSGAGGYFMGYYTIWLAPVKRFLVPFWELRGCTELERAAPTMAVIGRSGIRRQLRRVSLARDSYIADRSLKIAARASRTPSGECTAKTRGFNFRRVLPTPSSKASSLCGGGATARPKMGEGTTSGP